MTIRFSLPYRTTPGQRLAVCGSAAALGAWQLAQSLPLSYDEATTRWSAEIKLPAADSAAELTYKYVLLENHDQSQQWEWGPNRTLALPPRPARIELNDYWRPPVQEEHELFTNAFTQVLFRRAAPLTPSPSSFAATPSPSPFPDGEGGLAASSGSEFKLETRARTSPPSPSGKGLGDGVAGEATIRFALAAPRVLPHQVICVLGSDPALGSWDNGSPLLLSDRNYPTWEAEISLQAPTETLRYKYALWNTVEKEVEFLERGEDRTLAPIPYPPSAAPSLRILHDERFQYDTAWRGAGVALPVFALRSEKGLGVGEFPDLKLLIDWAVLTGMKLVQVLPINDTTATHTWVDSYPYAAISVFALHPQYLNLEGVGNLQSAADQLALDHLREELNAKDFVDYEPVMVAKWRFLKKLYQQEKKLLLADPAFQQFRREQAGWLVPYAAFSALRDRFGTADFSLWPAEFQTPQNLAELTAETAPDFDEFGLHFFTQFHLDKQLREAVDYGRAKGVVLKGDLPIGIYRHSVDAWTQPELYHMDAQAGAPPDDFSTTGQNWRFPTYNWERMAQDGYQWWKQRLGHLARYFDALRIDHILGFFRIWEIPGHSVEGLLGHFAPALPLHRDEIRRRLGWFDYGRLCEPYIRWHMLQDLLGHDAQSVFEEYMEDAGHGAIRLREHVRTQRQLETYIQGKAAAEPEHASYFAWLQTNLFKLVNEVLFVPAGHDFYHPRITLNKTYSFRELDGDEARRRLYDDIYVDFFFRRHEEFWREQGLVKLPPVRYATNMLIAGEDLGMVPASVPGVMRQLGMLSLHIQRMPSDPATEFGHPARAPYLSVVTTGSHDMSTIRGWWEEDRVRTQRFYETMLGHPRQVAPFYCEPWVAREIISQHLNSPAMWVILPLQDLLAMDYGLRRANPHDEHINVPGNPTHFWKYRLHLPLEELVEAVGFNEPLRALLEEAGRGQPG
ncbi:4-alpha-glucanotransferase [uncultured Hymenobacter sp.]|uniref:4-alpha-glucanotransferase n=1 Tax=uncultured Hymenobacter sp. TaxID=170016 RepID=UPI0035CAE941